MNYIAPYDDGLPMPDIDNDNNIEIIENSETEQDDRIRYHDPYHNSDTVLSIFSQIVEFCKTEQLPLCQSLSFTQLANFTEQLFEE